MWKKYTKNNCSMKGRKKKEIRKNKQEEANKEIT